jgi:enoyl-CoA hydratase/carnithine racemase
MTAPTTFERDPNGVCRFTLARPDAMNALNRATVDAITRTASSLQDDDAVRVVIFAALGDRAFCAGADLKERAGMREEEVADAVSRISEAMQAVADIRVPTIAAINGAALGGGFELALACDIRIASNTAVLGLPETSLAIIPGGGGTQRLPRVAGIARAKELIFTGRRISAAEASQYGIVHEVVDPDELRPLAVALAGTIASNGPVAVRAAKEAIARGMEMPLQQAVRMEQELYGRTIPTKDRLEGLEAFREKRAPVYRGE